MSEPLAVLDKHQALKVVSGNEKLAEDLLIMLIKELPDYAQGMQIEFDNANKEELRKIIHKMHGGLRYVGAPALTAIVSKTDTDLFELSEQQLKQSIEHICQEIKRIVEQKTYSD